MLSLDHVVYGVPDLEEALHTFEVKAGIRPTLAGKHPGLGTHNAILSLGNLQYLEFIALDPQAQIQKRELPSWCAALLTLSKPTIMTWVIRTDAMEKVVNELNLLGNFQIDPPQSFSRTKSDGTVVSMELAFKKQPPPPADGLIPFFINWGKTPHPSTTVECQCQLETWEGFHPNADELNKILQQVGIHFPIKKAIEPSMHLLITTPNGKIELN
jgi:hypothetical protein